MAGGRCGASGIVASGCQCSFASTTCMRLEGTGVPDDPFEVTPEFDGAQENILECRDGGLYASAAKGELYYAEILSNFNVDALEVESDVTGLTAPVIMEPGRVIRITAGAQGFSSDAFPEYWRFQIKEGSEVISYERIRIESANEVQNGVLLVRRLTPSAGSHVYKVHFGRETGVGSGNVAASGSVPAFIMVEDCGPDENL